MERRLNLSLAQERVVPLSGPSSHLGTENNRRTLRFGPRLGMMLPVGDAAKSFEGLPVVEKSSIAPLR
jgi:hypothetical protein